MFEQSNSRPSIFYPYSLGRIAAPKQLNTDEVELLLIEDSTMFDGQITDDIYNYTAEGKDNNDNIYKHEIKQTSSIRAKWMPFGDGNRVTSPDVRRGDEVLVYRLADSELYFWEEIGSKNILNRRLETVIYAWSGTPDINMTMKNIDPTKFYYMEISTHNGLVKFQTAKANEEKFQYTFQIETKKDRGSLRVHDDVGNIFELSSNENHLRMQNQDGSFLDITGRTLSQGAPDSILIVTKNLSIKAETAVDGNLSCNKVVSAGRFNGPH